MKWLLLTILLAVVAVTVWALLRRSAARADRPANDPINRLAAHSAHRRDYRLFVEALAICPDTWLEVDTATTAEVTLADGRRVPAREVRSFLVAYPNGELLDGHNLFAPLPTGIYAKDFTADTGVLPPAAPAEWERGRQYASVTHGSAAPHPTEAGILQYATTLRNVGGERFRVLHFGGYGPGRNLAPGKRYSAEDFVQWYGTRPDGWVAPGESVTDASNWSVPGITWAYFCVTEAGTIFVVAARAP